MSKQQGPAGGSKTHEGYSDVDKIENADGLRAVISKRKYDGLFTFGISRVYHDHGQEKTTSFVPEHLVESYIALLILVKERIAQLRSENAKAVQKGA